MPRKEEGFPKKENMNKKNLPITGQCIRCLQKKKKGYSNLALDSFMGKNQAREGSEPNEPSERKKIWYKEKKKITEKKG